MLPSQKWKIKESTGILDLFAKQRKRKRRENKRAMLRDEVEEYLAINFDTSDDDCSYSDEQIRQFQRKPMIFGTGTHPQVEY